jgi:glycosyltransferase involved in cell wall biosynthesis
MHIGLFFEGRHDLGGGFQQALSTVDALTRPGALPDRITIFVAYEETGRFLRTLGHDAVLIPRGVHRALDRWSATAAGHAILRRARALGFSTLGRRLDALLEAHGIDLVILTELDESGLRIGDHPFIVTLWDMDHRDHQDIPEVFRDRAFERIERARTITLTRAVGVIVNSEAGARKLAARYHVPAHRMAHLPFLPSLGVRRHAAGLGTATVSDVRRKYRLVNPYVFYPAYYSFHKNHLYVLEALRALERRHGIALDAVFAGGGDVPIRMAVARQVRALGLETRVHMVGLVPDADIPALYEGAVALTMPAIFGPTHLPTVEAITLGCPAIYSDEPDHREQLGDAALYCDLRDPDTMADHLAALVHDPGLRQRMIATGLARSRALLSADYGEALRPLLDRFRSLRRRWTVE